ncbi:WD40 repeat-like protein [Paxillus ammoniavirescens]|nr:WD40 repeat-like protein [Paxillus ammoniavirescens]
MSETSKEAVNLSPKPLLTISGHEGSVRSMTYLPHGGRLVSCSSDGTVRIWDVENGEQEGISMTHDGWIWGLAVTRDGKRILSGGQDEVLRVWDVETHQAIVEWRHEAAIFCVAVSPDDQLLASGDRQGRIVIRETDENGQIKHAIETVPGDVNSICFSPDGTKLASGHDDYSIRVFDVENGNLILGPIEGHTKRVNSVVWSLDGSRLFTASGDHSIRFWDAETGEATREPSTDHTQDIITISLSPDGSKLISASSDHTVRFWGTDSEPMPTAPGHYRGFSIMVESVSSTDSLNENQSTPAPPVNSEDVQVSCCALFSRRRARSGTASVPPAIPLSPRAVRTSDAPVSPVATPSHPTVQSVLDRPAVVEPLSDTHR